MSAPELPAPLPVQKVKPAKLGKPGAASGHADAPKTKKKAKKK